MQMEQKSCLKPFSSTQNPLISVDLLAQRFSLFFQQKPCPKRKIRQSYILPVLRQLPQLYILTVLPVTKGLFLQGNFFNRTV